MEINSIDNIFSSLIIVNSPVLNATFKANTIDEEKIKCFVSDKVEDVVVDKCAEHMYNGNLNLIEVLIGGPMATEEALKDTTIKVVKPDFNSLNALISACNEAFVRKDSTAIDTYEAQYGKLPEEIRNNIDNIIDTK